MGDDSVLIPDHKHCHDCGAVIAAGDELPAMAPVAVPQPNGGLAIVPKPVFVCADCMKTIEKRELEAKIASKIVLPARGSIRPT